MIVSAFIAALLAINPEPNAPLRDVVPVVEINTHVASDGWPMTDIVWLELTRIVKDERAVLVMCVVDTRRLELGNEDGKEILPKYEDGWWVSRWRDDRDHAWREVRARRRIISSTRVSRDSWNSLILPYQDRRRLQKRSFYVLPYEYE